MCCIPERHAFKYWCALLFLGPQSFTLVCFCCFTWWPSLKPFQPIIAQQWPIKAFLETKSFWSILWRTQIFGCISLIFDKLVAYQNGHVLKTSASLLLEPFFFCFCLGTELSCGIVYFLFPFGVGYWYFIFRGFVFYFIGLGSPRRPVHFCFDIW